MFTYGEKNKFLKGYSRRIKARSPGFKFRILIKTVGDAVFLIRREDLPTEVIQSIYSYRHTFPVCSPWTAEVEKHFFPPSLPPPG